MTTQLATIVLPDDMEWIDEFQWQPAAQQIEVASNGALLVEESVQLAGRPITLEGRIEGNVGFALPTRAVIKQLQDLASAAHVTPLTLTLHDGRSFDVLFRRTDGAAVEARPLKHIAPHDDADLYALTLRLMQV